MDIDFNKKDIEKSINDLNKAFNDFRKNVEPLSKSLSEINKIIKGIKKDNILKVENNIKNIKTLIIPDVHCRDFYKEPLMYVLEKLSDVNVVFLGDYLDGYSHEWMEGMSGRFSCDYSRKGIDNLKEIIELKKKYNERIILLLGNHDLTYIYGTKFCKCRTDYINWGEIYNLFKENIGLFKICHDEIINNKRIVYSHSGFNKMWENTIYEVLNIEKTTDKDEPINCDILNDLFIKSVEYHYEDEKEPRYDGMFDILSDMSYLRGGYTSYGSIVWGDIRDFSDTYINEELTNEALFNDVIQVVGHTQLENMAVSIRGKIFDLDVRQCFYIDDKAIIRYYNTDKNVWYNDGK